MDLHSKLAQIIHPTRVHTRLIDRLAYANDASYFRLVPQAVVQPHSISEIQSLFKFTQQNKIPLTFRAAGTSLSGQAVTDGILVDISKHWDKYSVEEHGRLIRFQPGIVGGFINNVLKSHHRRIGPDPASIDACMMGGILANNSSGMCCGVVENSYRTIHSMTFVLPNGFMLDTATSDADRIFENEQPHLAKGLLEFKQRIMNSSAEYKGEKLADKIRRRYQMKNTNGYLLNAFLDFDSPLGILTHLLIGSEGTLGFIAEAVLHTLPDHPRRYTGQLYFRNLQDAAAAIAPIKASGARAAEIMDRASLRSVEHFPDVPSILRQLPNEATAILVEYQAQDADSIASFVKEAGRIVKQLRLLHDPEFTADPSAQANLWKTRKGIIPSIGGMRAAGTTCVNEDVAFPVKHLADAVTDLQYLFKDFGYADGAVFGHAKDGNLHFLVNQAFNTEADTRHFDSFMQAMVNLVSGKYDGALKAEHGTGRNMASFVETEWGPEAYAIMRDLKSLLDPSHMLNPGVMINSDPQAHTTHLKSMTLVSPQIDKCIECGFCESRCPSRRLTLTPRQRIVIQRELARRRLIKPAQGAVDDAWSEIESDFLYSGIDTCAADGLCATACPVGINTGEFIKHMRSESIKEEQSALWIANHFTLAENTIGTAITLGHFAEKIVGGDGVKSIMKAVEKISSSTLPKWNNSIPHQPKKLRVFGGFRVEKEFIYFPSCISRQLGVPSSRSQVSGSHLSLSEALFTLAQRAGIKLYIPENTTGHCCGMPFASKGYNQASQIAVHTTLQQMWDWTDHGRYPIVIDTTSCTHTLRTCGGELSAKDKNVWSKLTFLDGIEFLHDHILPKLKLQPLEENVVLHPNCSARKLGLDNKMLSIANQCAKSATVPLTLGCCAFAGDRGLLFPELTRSATEKESAEVLARAYDGYYSSNIPCEIGMSESTGQNYVSIIYLVEKASRKNDGKDVL
jgi:D-lactate dehydrogenase